MSKRIEKVLIDFGLSEKAAKVYLANLELGPSTVQQISKKADVNRPTTYVMIDTLKERGLISSYEKGKKRFFTAEDPEQFIHLAEAEKRLISNREESIKQVLGDLRALMEFSSSPPDVSYYEGIDGVNALREDVIRSNADMIRELVPLDDVRKFIPEETTSSDLRSEIRKRASIKSLYTTNKGDIYSEKEAGIESRYLDPEVFPVSCEVIIYGDKIAFLSFSGKPTGFLIDSRAVAVTLTMMFEHLWSSAKKK